MKFTLSWLKDHLDTDASVDKIADTLTHIGLEVEGVEDKAKDLAAFTVAYVVSAEKHPNADKLRVCIVDTGTEKLQVVCGAPNARTGMKGVFVKREDAVRSFKEIVDGKCDDLPEEAFKYVGTTDDARAKAKKLQEG